MLYTASYDDISSGVTGRICICDGSRVSWIMSVMNPWQLGGLSMEELDNNQNASRMSYKLVSSCDGSQTFANIFLNLDILGSSYIFTRPLIFAKSNIFQEVMVCFIIGCVESVSDLGYCEDIKPMACVRAPVAVSSLWSKLLTMNWRKHSIDVSSDSVSMNSIVDTLAHFSKPNIAEYDVWKSQCLQNINQNTWSCDLINKQTDSK